MFVTSGVYTGSAPGGLMFYDGKCKTLAAGKDSLVNRTFVAWMSSAADSAKKRIGSSSLPYLLTDGVTKVADVICFCSRAIITGHISKTTSRRLLWS